MYLNDEQVHAVLLTAPVNTASTATANNSDVINAGKCQSVQFLVPFGAITGDSTVVTVQECDDTTPSNSTAIAFSYRLGSAVGTDSSGTRTAATSSGVTVTDSDDNKLLIIDVDPASLTDGYPYLRVVVDPGASISAQNFSVIALVVPRYAQGSPLTIVT